MFGVLNLHGRAFVIVYVLSLSCFSLDRLRKTRERHVAHAFRKGALYDTNDESLV